VVAEACKVKDAMFFGNIMAVQDANFVMMNKIGYCVKCQTGFAVPQNLRRFGVNYIVMNLLGAYTDPNLPVERKDELLEAFYGRMEEAAEEGVGVLLYSFQDFVWCCFNVVCYWMRKYRWTVDHACAVMKSRRPAVTFEANAVEQLHALAARLSARGVPSPDVDEESVLTHTFSNAQKHGTAVPDDDTASSPNTRARPITAHAGRIKWQPGSVENVCNDRDVNPDVPLRPPTRAITPILRLSRGGRKKGEEFTSARFLTPGERVIEEMRARNNAPVHGTWSATAAAAASAHSKATMNNSNNNNNNNNNNNSNSNKGSKNRQRPGNRAKKKQKQTQGSTVTRAFWAHGARCCALGM